MLPRPSESVVCEPVSEGAVLLDMGSEAYFGLNEVGLEIWRLLPPVCQDSAELCARLRARYPEVPPEALAADVDELLEALRAHGLVTTSTAPAAAAAGAG